MIKDIRQQFEDFVALGMEYKERMEKFLQEEETRQALEMQEKSSIY